MKECYSKNITHIFFKKLCKKLPRIFLRTLELRDIEWTSKFNNLEEFIGPLNGIKYIWWTIFVTFAPLFDLCYDSSHNEMIINPDIFIRKCVLVDDDILQKLTRFWGDSLRIPNFSLTITQAPSPGCRLPKKAFTPLRTCAKNCTERGEARRIH